MTLTQPEQRVRTGARRVPMKAAAIIAALGIALIVTMGPAPASAQTTVVRECGGQYTVTHYNSDGSVQGVHNKQLSDEGTIYTGGKTWKLVEGEPDRFVSDGGAQLQVVACDATPGSGTRGIGVRQAQGTQTSTTLVRNIGQTDSGSDAFSNDHAQAFTTGSNSAGYTLTSVTLRMRLTSATQQPYQASINRDASGVPGGKAGALTPPTLVPTDQALQWINRDFTASGDGIDLEANTTYWFVIDASTSSSAIDARLTASDDEGSGGADGWSIADKRLSRSFSGSNWSGSQLVFKLAISGYLKAPALVSAEVNGTSLVLTYDHGLDTTSRTAARQFGIRFGGGALQRATAISISGRQVTLTVPEVRSGQVVTVSYTKPTRNPLKGSGGPEVDAFTNQTVTVKTGPAFGRSATGKVRTAVYVTYTNADGEEVTVENRAASADRETLLDYYEDACRANPDSRFDTPESCASHGLYLRQSNCASENWRLWNPHLLDTWCPDDRTW